jgi:regulator of PEP synthase PpsR (kinase-PPPase family)
MYATTKRIGKEIADLEKWKFPNQTISRIEKTSVSVTEITAAALEIKLR